VLDGEMVKRSGIDIPTRYSIFVVSRLENCLPHTAVHGPRATAKMPLMLFLVPSSSIRDIRRGSVCPI
jgi:hypothetical protein